MPASGPDRLTLDNMERFDRLSLVQSLMLDFADRTGLTSPVKPPRRYLWTDAFAVCNFLELYRRTQDDRFLKLALGLIEQVHETLGRHRPDDIRRGWISGLDEVEGRRHPTAGGLRIGKTLPERSPGDPDDENREWDQDGQYFHYLIKWMHALHRVGQVTGDIEYNRFARELVRTAHARFTYTPPSGGLKRMYWKMSIDLTRPLVMSMGHHDPLDGLITYYELSYDSGGDDQGSDLSTEILEMTSLCRNRVWTTDDPLGLGGLLTDACHAGQLMKKGLNIMPEFLDNILSSALDGLASLFRKNTLTLPARYRLPFREFGLSIGLQAAAKLKKLMTDSPASFNTASMSRSVEEILFYGQATQAIEEFWLDPSHQHAETWTEHRDINEIMLATALAPDEFLRI